MIVRCSIVTTVEFGTFLFLLIETIGAYTVASWGWVLSIRRTFYSPLRDSTVVLADLKLAATLTGSDMRHGLLLLCIRYTFQRLVSLKMYLS